MIAWTGWLLNQLKRLWKWKTINYVLPFVKEKYEDELKDAFERTLVVRELSGDAAELADYWFFETAVRLHLKGRGISYTGLKPAHINGEPIIVMANQAVKSENLNDLMNFILSAIREDVEARFDDVLSKNDFDVNDVDDARDYADAILNFFGYLQTLIEFMEEG